MIIAYYMCMCFIKGTITNYDHDVQHTTSIHRHKKHSWFCITTLSYNLCQTLNVGSSHLLWDYKCMSFDWTTVCKQRNCKKAWQRWLWLMSDMTEEYFVWRLTTCGYVFREETVTNCEHDVQNTQILHTTVFFHRSKVKFQ